jgi:hypothetical protein
MKGLTRVAGMGMVFLLAGASAGYAAVMEEAGLDCADYISSGAYDKPLEGHLIGTEDVTVVTSSTLSTSGSVGGGPVPGTLGGGTSDTQVTTVEYEVGYYKMSDGSILRIDCRTYTIAR